jgi:hypothetical protein
VTMFSKLSTRLLSRLKLKLDRTLPSGTMSLWCGGGGGGGEGGGGGGGETQRGVSRQLWCMQHHTARRVPINCQVAVWSTTPLTAGCLVGGASATCAQPSPACGAETRCGSLRRCGAHANLGGGGGLPAPTHNTLRLHDIQQTHTRTALHSFRKTCPLQTRRAAAACCARPRRPASAPWRT